MIDRRGILRGKWIRIGGGVCGVITAGVLIPLVLDFCQGQGQGQGEGQGPGGRVDLIDEAWSFYSSFRQTRMMGMASQSGRQAALLRAIAVIALGCWIGRTFSAAIEDAARVRKDVLATSPLCRVASRARLPHLGPYAQRPMLWGNRPPMVSVEFAAG